MYASFLVLEKDVLNCLQFVVTISVLLYDLKHKESLVLGGLYLIQLCPCHLKLVSGLNSSD